MEVLDADLEVGGDNLLDDFERDLFLMVVREDVLEGLGDDICRDGLLDEGSVGDDARQGALEFADVAVDAVGDEHQDIVRHVDVVEQRLVLEDGDARLEVRRLDVGDQAASCVLCLPERNWISSTIRTSIVRYFWRKSSALPSWMARMISLVNCSLET